MLRIAVPNKGTLSQPASQMLRDAGYRQRTDPKDLVCRDEANNVEFFYLRPRDIATYVGSGDLDLGITGRDLLVDSGVPAAEVVDLNFGGATFRWAAPAGSLSSVEEIGGRRIATAYPGVVERWLAEHELKADVVRLDGAVENAVRLGVADVIADVVETGTTLRNAGLEVFGDPILRSEAVLVRAASVGDDPAVDVLVRRLQGVLVARQYVLMDYDVRVELVEKASLITPGLESPTISPLHDPGWVAVRAMVPRGRTNQVMDELYALGARAILVTSIHACRL
jgi:ATP phosphoribosyltransferase